MTAHIVHFPTVLTPSRRGSKHIVTVNGIDYDAYTDDQGVVRFPERECPELFEEYPILNEGFRDLNAIWMDFNRGAFEVEDVMDLYMSIGYSVFGFWEVFGWEVNASGNYPLAEIYLDGLEYPDEWEEYCHLETETERIENEKRDRR